MSISFVATGGGNGGGHFAPHFHRRLDHTQDGLAGAFSPAFAAFIFHCFLSIKLHL